MESASKRKAASAAVVENENRPAKRQKVPADTSANAETVETTRALGLKFLENLKQAKDKTGRPIAGAFLHLPPQDTPGYYEAIKLPIALDTIEGKLNRGEYATLAQVESDCKRMVNNAKQFNEKRTPLYEDAERLRKTASNWMVKHNPAYRDNNYSAVATPIPGEENYSPARPAPRVASTPRVAPAARATIDTVERPRRAAAIAQPTTPAPSKLRQSASVVPEAKVDDNPEGTKQAFQQTQERIIREIIEYTEPGVDFRIFEPFVNLPPRGMKDYYQLIKDPMSLSAIQKKVRGVVGREAPTGVTLFKSWDALENAMSLIWKNARIYNEDGSAIYELSIELEEMFKKKLEAARATVEEPPQPKLKLNMSVAAPTPSSAPRQQLKLKLRQSPGSDPNTPGARSSATPGVIVDNEALLRQQKHVLQGMKNPPTSRPPSAGKAGTPSATPNPFTGPRGGSASIVSNPVAQARAAGSPTVHNGVKQDVQSPALGAIRPASTVPDTQNVQLSVPAQTPHPTMAPPQTISRPASGSPFPTGPMGQQSGYAPPYQQPNYYVPPPPAPRVDNFRKTPLKSINEALLPKITLNTHPALNLAKPWSVDVYANKQKTANSATIIISPTHSYLQIVPKVPVALTDRVYRLFVTVNGHKAFEVNRIPVTAGINGGSPGPGYEGGKKKGEPVYEAKLVGGVNRIEVEVIAEKTGPDSREPKDMVEIERCTIFLHLMRQSIY